MKFKKMNSSYKSEYYMNCMGIEDQFPFQHFPALGSQRSVLKGGSGSIIGGGAIDVPAAPSGYQDNFNRDPENPLDNGNWTTITGRGALQVTTDQKCRGTGGGGMGAFWSVNSFDPDQYSQFKQYGINGQSYAAVRVSSSANTWYGFGPVGTTYCQLERMIAGSQTVLESSFDVTWSDGDTIRLEVSGDSPTHLSCKIDHLGAGFTEVKNYDDNSTAQIISGSAGIVMSINNWFDVDDWEGGDL